MITLGFDFNYFNLLAIATVDPTKWVITGSGLGPSIEAYKTYQINLQAKDSLSNNIMSGGSIFRAVISNKWSRTTGFSWDIDASVQSTLSNSIHGTMIDNGDGTYFYQYSLNNKGNITVSYLV